MNRKKSWIVILCVTFVFTALFASPGVCEDKVYKIGIATIATHPALDATRQGFIDEMAAEGFVEGKNVEYDIGNAEGDMTLAASIAKKFV